MALYYVDAIGGSDANPGTSTGAAKQTLAAGVALLNPGDTLYVKYGTYTITATQALTAAQCGTTRAARTIIEGYITTPGDTPDGSASPTITTTTNSIALLTYQSGAAAAYFMLRSLRFVHAGATRGQGIVGATGAGSVAGAMLIERVEISGCTNGISGGSRLTIDYARRLVCRGNSAAGLAATSLTSSSNIEESRFIGNGTHGVDVGTNLQVSPSFRRCVFSGNTLCGLVMTAQARTVSLNVWESTFEGNGSDHIQFTYTTGVLSGQIQDCVFWGTGGYGANISGSGGGSISTFIGYGNAYGLYSTGPSQGFTMEVNPLTLTSDPFANAAAEDWAPNATAGAGALLRGAGTGDADIGAVQHADGGGGSTGGYIIGA